MIKDYFEFAFSNLRRRKLRSWLTMVGIFISIAVVFVLISLSIGLKGAVQQEFNSLGTDKFFVQPSALMQGGPGSGGAAANFTTNDVDVIERVPGVTQLTYLVIGSAEVVHDGKKRFFQIAGVPTDKLDLLKTIETYSTLEDGRFLQRGELGKAIVGNSFKTGNLFGTSPIKVGDKMTINDKEFKVAGIMKSFGTPSDDKNIYIPYEDFKTIFNSGNRVDEVIVQISDGENIENVAGNVQRALLKYRNLKEKNKDFSIFTPEELLASLSLILNILTGFLIGVAGISLVVGAIGIANTMYTSVIERTREIGVMKAIGARNKDILQIFLIESGLLGLAGGILGVILGFILSKGIEYVISNNLGFGLLKAASPVWLIIGCLIFSFLIGAVSGVLPAYQASKVKPVEALRYE